MSHFTIGCELCGSTLSIPNFQCSPSDFAAVTAFDQQHAHAGDER